MLITVVGEYKPGRVRFSVTDLTVPLTGLPITIDRTYDSLERNRLGDFGYGWALSVGSPHLTVDPAHNVTLTQPNGKRVTFYFTPSSYAGVFGFLLEPGYTPEPGVYGSLRADGCTIVVGTGAGYQCFLDPEPRYQPASYTYTDPYGRVYTMGASGALKSITDLNGNTLTFSANGIVSSAGDVVVPFVRDGQGRITQITDPTGNVYRYGYDAAGNLASVNSPRVSQPVIYTYDANHLIRTIVDARGSTEASTTYYEDGRLESETDALGNMTRYTYNLSTRTTTTTNPDGGVETTIFDDYGKLLREVDPLGRMKRYVYDSNHNMLLETNALSETTTYTYDNSGNRTVVTDALRYTWRASYNQYSGPTSEIDPLGNAETITYNERFMPASSHDNLGTRAGFTFDDHGNLLVFTDGNVQTTRLTYDVYGNRIRELNPLGYATTHVYDQLGRKLASTDALSHTTSYQYDPLGHQLAVTNALNQTTSYEYDANSNKVVEIDPLGRRTTYTYDALNRLIKVTYPDNTMITYTYNWRGQRLTETDQVGHTRSYEYDLAGQLLRSTRASNTAEASTTQYSYDAAGRRVREVDAPDHATSYTYDAIGQLIQVTDALNQTTEYHYDAARRRTEIKDAEGHTTRFAYDARGRLTVTTYPDDTTSRQEYDGAAHVIRTLDQAGEATIYGYDSVGQLIAVTDALSQTTSYGYDQVGNRKSITDANNHTTRFEFDALRRQTSRILPLGMRDIYRYDSLGNLESKIDFNGKTTTYTYDALNRLLGKRPDLSLNEPEVRFTYTATGQRATMVDASGTTTYTYDAHDRLVAKATPQGALYYSYDLAGNLRTLRSSNAHGVSVEYSYDAANRLESVTDQRLATSTKTTSYTHDPTGEVIATTYPNGAQVDTTYDALHRPLSQTMRLGGTTLASYAYTLDATGHRERMVEADGRTVDYRYDALYRLGSETINSDPLAANNGSVQYAYDAVGNRLNRDSTLAAVLSTSATYDANDRLIGETYDANGNMLAANGATYAYDFENRITSVNNGAITTVYDGDGNRVALTTGGVTTGYLVDDLNPTGYAQVVEELVNGQVQRTYTYGHDLISQNQFVDGGWTPSFYGYDSLGTVRFLTDSGGTITDQYTYDAFGAPLATQGTTPNVYLFTGEQFDTNLGLYYLRARYYTTESGRFLTQDPYPGRVQEPLTLNKYIYAHADPVNNTDPTGLLTVDRALTQSKVSLPSRQALIVLGLTVACVLARTASEFATAQEIAQNGGKRVVFNPCYTTSTKETCATKYPEYRRCDSLPTGYPHGYDYPSAKTAFDEILLERRALGLNNDGVKIETRDTATGGPCAGTPDAQHLNVRQRGRQVASIGVCKCCDDSTGSPRLQTKCAILNRRY